MKKLLGKGVFLEYNSPKEHKSKSGIIIDYREPDQQKAKVLFVGHKCDYGLNPGDTVLFKRMHAHRETVEGVTYLAIPEDFIIGIVE